MRTPTINAQNVERQWHVVDARGQVLGRLASQVAQILRGKTKPIYSPHVDTGDHVIIINASQVVVTGKKAEQKLYYRYSGYPGGLKVTPYQKLFARSPERVVRMAVKGMLPHTTLGRQMFRKLKVYRGSTHPHAAQKPDVLKMG
ncbi:MAG: 50S ribosomal protein L13 [Candidatus Latescibacteria bacterium]|nr:50S ribosomal protein L13 [Candidatus Latescibacterota bacterium]